ASADWTMATRGFLYVAPFADQTPVESSRTEDNSYFRFPHQTMVTELRNCLRRRSSSAGAGVGVSPMTSSAMPTAIAGTSLLTSPAKHAVAAAIATATPVAARTK